jgi:hypothetical protein
MSGGAGRLGALFLFLAAATSAAIDLDISPADIETALKVARAPEATRAAFHARYVFASNHPTVERIEVVTERRRVVLLAESRIAGGDHLFAHGTRAASEALRPWRGRVSVIARLRFHPQNTYVMAPPIDLSVRDNTGDVPRVDLRIETMLALSSGVSGERLPVVGAVAEAMFAAGAIGQATRTAVVRMDGVELARLAIDFSRIE